MRFYLFVSAIAFLRRTEEGSPVISPKTLQSVTSIACLKELETNPSADCAKGDGKEKMTSTATRAAAPHDDGTFFIGGKGFPKPNVVPAGGDLDETGESVCHDGGEYFCDPEHILTEEQRDTLVTHLRTVRQNTLVTCPLPILRGRLGDSPNSPRQEDEVNFILGAVIFKNLPSEEHDEASLQKFGEMLIDDWEIKSSCDRASILIIVTEPKLFWVASQGCRFACGQNQETGRRVVNALGSVGTDDYEAAFEAGITTFLDVLKENKDAERVAGLHDDRWSAYLRRKEEQWKKYENAIYWSFGIVAGLVFLKFSSFLWGAFEMGDKAGSAALWAKSSYLRGLYWLVSWTLWTLNAIWCFIRESFLYVKDGLVYTGQSIVFTLSSMKDCLTGR